MTRKHVAGSYAGQRRPAEHIIAAKRAGQIVNKEKTMAYDLKKLIVWAYHDTHTLWRYDTDDAIDDVSSPGYFNDAADMLRHGDVIQVTSYWMEECPIFRFFGVLIPKSLGKITVMLAPVQ